MTQYFLKLRNNIEIESDIELALMESRALFEGVTVVKKGEKIDFLDEIERESFSRNEGVIGFKAKK